MRYPWGMLYYALAAVLFFATPVAQAGADWTIRRDGARLTKNGHLWRMVGGNNYRAAGGPPALACQSSGTAQGHTAHLEALLGQMAKDGLNTLRVWAFQSYTGPGGDDFAALDRLVAAAGKHHVRLIMVLENQWADCTQGGTKPASWYASGYRAPYGAYRRSLPAYASALVRHFRGEATIVAWQLMNESESTDGNALFAFARDMSAVVKAADSGALVSLGTLACRQWGTDAANMKRIHALSTIDLVEAHDYGAEADPMPDCISEDMQVARDVRKPFFLGEVGLADNRDPKVRGARLAAKLRAQFDSGSHGVLVWSVYGEGSNDKFQVPVGSPIHQALVAEARR